MTYICSMKQFTSHIDFLLQKHDCVIIPDFGGFVLSREEAFIIPDGAIRPPHVVVGFNPDLKYNDGLLAESYMNVYDISYDAACKKIKENVDKLNNALSLGQAVQMGRLGRLKIDENKQLKFIPNHYLSLYYPDTFGLSLARVKRLSDIPLALDKDKQAEKQAKTRKIPFVNIVTGAAAAAAAVLIFFVASTPISQNGNDNVQQSGFFTDVLSAKYQPTAKLDKAVVSSVISRTDKAESKAEDDVTELATSPKETVAVPNNTEAKIQSIETRVATPKNNAKPQNTNKPSYYVIIGSATSKGEADKVLSRLKSQGFSSSKLMPSNGQRYRIYVSSFQDKNEAERYLANFRKKNPKLADAWLFTTKG